MEKRQILFFILAGATIFFWSSYMAPKRPVPKKNQVAKAEPAVKAAAKPKDDKAAAKPSNKDAKPAVSAAKPDVPLRVDLVLGKDGDPEYAIYAKLSNRGAVVTRLQLNQYLDEKRNGPFVLLSQETPGVESFGLSLTADDEEGLRTRNWEVAEASESRVVFRTTAKDGKLRIEKIFTLEKDSPIVGLSVSVTNISEGPVDEVSYTLTSGNGLPIEGKWYTSYFRKLAGAQMQDGSKYASYFEEDVTAIAKAAAEGKAGTVYSQSPVQFAGVVTQYFASMVIQKPAADVERTIASVRGIDLDAWLAERDPKLAAITSQQPTFHNIAAEISSVSRDLAKGEQVTHEFLLYNGPKKEATLAQFSNYHLPILIHYTDFMLIPVGRVAQLMVFILNVLHSFVQDYGIAIILLTVLVRSAMFPLSFRQTKSMQKMQALQPKLEEIKKKYADDREKQRMAMAELYSKENINPVAGCLPLFLQLPIFVGLYQSLQSSFSLRQSSFLWGMTWVKDLAAPDQLFPFGMNVPMLGPYFNLLPILAMGQMILQMIYMSPPSTTPEAKMQKQIMMFMMVFMGTMFYKVPAGLCVYLITSGAWSMLERKLLPKAPTPAAVAVVAPSSDTGSNGHTSWKSPVGDKKKGKARR